MYNDARDVISIRSRDSKEIAEDILLQWLAAWKIKDAEQRLQACNQCKLRTIEWEKHHHN